jgi:hypothetical protein
MLDTQIGTIHVRGSLSLFGLKLRLDVRGGDMNGNDLQSMTLAMYFLKSQDRKSNTPEELRTGSEDLGYGTCVSLYAQFKYRGSIVTPDLSENTENGALCFIDTRGLSQPSENTVRFFWPVAKHGQSRMPTSLNWRHSTTDALDPCTA